MNSMMNLKHIDAIPLPYRVVFSEFICFNRMQSQVLDAILHSDESLVISAPTGSGKTVVFELGIIKLLLECGSSFPDFKIVYISPIKSLCHERLVDWVKKFSRFGINCVCVTGDSDNIDYHQLINHNLIISTPEKWDSLTRKWRDNETFVKEVKLFMIDEVHLLNDDDRGSTLEVIVSRMKTVQNSMARNVCQIRFMAVSATIGNIEDIAEWLEYSKVFQFPNEMRPVQLKTLVLGYPSQNASSPFKFDLSLNYRLQNLIIQHSEGQPTLIFCSTRKSVEMTARHLIQTLKIQISPNQCQKLVTICDTISDIKIKESIKHGIGIHHAGMSVDIRHTVETAFREGHLPILVATSTLAMGVNLPAHLVIIKSTKYYSNGSYQDYSSTAIHQMIGRAGRPQFDTSATALILTTNESKKKIERQLNSNEPVESNLHKHLTEHLNAEVVLGTITGLDVAMHWLASTFLYIRARKNPKHYGLPQTCRQDQLDKKLMEIFQIDLNKLMRVGMITMDEKINVTPTMTGRLMARYYVDFETMKMFTQISGTEVFIQILALISKCQEFSEMRLRVNDKKSLNLLNRNSKKQTIRFPLNGKIKTWDMKVNCIIQAVLGNLEITDSSIQTESYLILRNGQRIIKCLIDYLSLRNQNCYNALLHSIVLGKCLHAKLWEDSPFVSKQLNGIGSILATQLANAGKTTFEKILESSPREIELFVKRKPPFGNYLLDEVRNIPRYSMILEKCHQGLKIMILLENVSDVSKKCTVNLSSLMYLIVGNNFNEILAYEKYQVSYTIDNPTITKFINLKSSEDLEFVEANLISAEWVGIDRNCKVLFSNENKFGDGPNSPKIVEKNPGNKESSYIQTFLDIYMKIKKPIKQKKGEKNPKMPSKEIENNIQLKKQPDNKKMFMEYPENQIKMLYDQLINNKPDNSKNEENNKEKLSLPKNLTDTELDDILEDHKIITAYKNAEISGKLDNEKAAEGFYNLSNSSVGDNFEAEEEIVYSNNDVQDYEEIIDCNDDRKDYEGATVAVESNNVEEDVDKCEENGKNSGKDDCGGNVNVELTDILPEELEEIFNCSSPMFSDSETCVTKNVNENEETGNVVEEKEKLDLNALTKTDPVLFSIAQKYLTDVDSEERSIISKPSKQGATHNNTLKNILNFRGKRKRKSDELHPTEELEEYIHKEEHEKKSFLNTFRKPTKKKLSNDSQVDNFPESTITGPAYKITEILEPNSRRSAKNSNFNNLENQKSIKWRSPLVFSPGMKFSPKINHKNMFGANKAEFEYQNERYNESFETTLSSASSKNSKNFSMKLPSNNNKTPTRRSTKSDQNIFKSFTASSATPFPLSDKEYEHSLESNKSKIINTLEQFTDICSSQLLDTFNLKDSKESSNVSTLPLSDKDCNTKARTGKVIVNESDLYSPRLKTKDNTFTPRKLRQNNPESAGDYFSQLVPQHQSQKLFKTEMESSQQTIIENNENIEYEDEQLEQERFRCEIEAPRPQHHQILSQNKPLTFDRPNNEIRTRSEEYINSKIRENYPVYSEFEPSTSSSSRYFMAPTMGSREYIEYDTGAASAGLNSSFRPVAMERSAPKPSMHYSHYVDPVNFGYHPSYGQYVRPPCYEYPKVLHRNLPVGYVELPPVDPNLIATRCPPPGYQPEAIQMTPFKRRLSEEEYPENVGQELSRTNPMVSTRHVYADTIEHDLNSSFAMRHPSYPVPYQGQNYPCSVSYGSNAGYAFSYSRERPHPYGYVAETPGFPIVDKDYVMNKYWGSLNTQQ